MINGLLNQLAVSAEPSPPSASHAAHLASQDFDQQMSRRLAQARSAEEGFDDAQHHPSASSMSETFDPAEAAGFEDIRTSPQLPSLRSDASFTDLSLPASRSASSSTNGQRNDKAASTGPTAEALTAAHQMRAKADEQSGASDGVRKRRVIKDPADGIDEITTSMRPSPSAVKGLLELSGRRSAAERGTGIELKNPDHWATPQIVETMDEAWRPSLGEKQDMQSLGATPELLGKGLMEAVDPLAEAADTVQQMRVSDTFRSYVEGQRAQLTSSLASSSSMLRAVADQVRSLMDGLGLEGQLKLRTHGAEIQVRSDTLGTLAARIGMQHGVVDLTLSGQAAASLTSEIDALKAMLAEAGLHVGTIKTTLQSSDGSQRDEREQNDPEAEERSGSGSSVAEEDEGVRHTSRTRHRAHHGQLNVSA